MTAESSTPEAATSPESSGEARVDIELLEVQKTLGNFHVLRGISFEVRHGETFVMMGLSGTGKSVTLRHIVGLMHPDSGRVKVFGQDLSKLEEPALKKIRLRIGYLFQSGALINWMTIRDNIALPLHEHQGHLSDEEIEERVLEKLRLVNLAQAVDKFPSEISGGMKKRAALARSIILEPEIILYDEPTSGLDPVMGATIDDLVNDTRDALGVSQVVVTHDIGSAYRIADRIGLLFEGEIIAIGTPDEIREHEDPIVQQFISGSSEGPITRILEEKKQASSGGKTPS